MKDKSECEECGETLDVRGNPTPNMDWIKVVCSNCGKVNNVSVVRLGEE